MDLTVPASIKTKFRKDWGLQNAVGLDPRDMPKSSDLISQANLNSFRQHKVRGKIASFVQSAVFPQQLSVPRQYATTREGCWIYKILEGRPVVVNSENGAKYREKGIRVVVQENARQARFVMSPLFGSKHDALAWAQSQMGADISGV